MAVLSVVDLKFKIVELPKGLGSVERTFIADSVELCITAVVEKERPVAEFWLEELGSSPIPVGVAVVDPRPGTERIGGLPMSPDDEVKIDWTALGMLGTPRLVWTPVRELDVSVGAEDAAGRELLGTARL